MHRPTTPRRLAALAAVGALALTAAACGGDDDGDAEGPAGTEGAAGGAGSDAGGGATEGGGEDVTLRLGYFPNVTHAPAIVGVEEGLFTESLGESVTLETSTFNAGPEVVEALASGALDASFIGPNPAINLFAQTDGEAIRIVSGSTSGGAALVVTPDITDVAQLEGAAIATPQLGNTQDVALRAFLADEGLETDEAGGGDVQIIPQANADTLAAFQQGQLDGAWVPEPWATRLQLEGDGVVLVDEADLWPDGEFVTTHLIVATDFLEEHPDVVRDLIAGEVAAIQQIEADPEAAQLVVNDGIEAATSTRLDDATIAGAFENLTFTWDPIASSLVESKDDAVAVGLLEPVELDGIYDLSLLDEVLAELGLDAVEAE